MAGAPALEAFFTANPEIVAALAGLAVGFIIYEGVVHFIDYSGKQGPKPESYPGQQAGKAQTELNKSNPAPAGPEHNPTPPVLPPSNKWKELLDNAADWIDDHLPHF